MLEVWIWENKERDNRCIFAPRGRVDLRRTEKLPAPLPIPPQATQPVGASLLTDTAEGGNHATITQVVFLFHNKGRGTWGWSDLGYSVGYQQHFRDPIPFSKSVGEADTGT